MSLYKSSLWNGSLWNGSLWNGSLWGVEGINLDLYNFYADFQTGIIPKDLVSGNLLTTTLSAGRFLSVNGVTTEFVENVPSINEDGANFLSAYTQFIKKTRDIKDVVWTKTDLTDVTATSFSAVALNGNVRESVTTIDSLLYTFSFKASVESGGQTTGYTHFHFGSETGNSTALTLTEIPTLYEITVLGASGGGAVLFGILDGNASNWAKVTITDFQVTQSSYRLPYAPNDSAVATISVPLNYSDADEGIKAKGITVNFPQLYTALYGTDGTDAQGKIIVTGKFKFDAADSSGTINLFTANDETGSFLRYDIDDEQFEAYDGTNEATVAYTAVNDTEYELHLIYGDSSGQKMQLAVGEVAGSLVTHAGSFPTTADDFSIAWENSDWITVESIIMPKAVTFL